MSQVPSPLPAVLFEMLSAHVALVTINRPDKRNAVNAAVAEGLEAAVDRTENDPEVRAVILNSSHHRVFCAGADLAAIAAGGAASTQTMRGGFAGLVYSSKHKPWIAAVEGLAVAGGFELCLACDMIVASRSAKFGLPETQLGLMAGAGGLHRLPRRLPLSIASEMIATGDLIDAERAYATGLINRLVDDGEALATARLLADRISRNAPLSVQYSLTAMKAAAALPDGAGRTIVADSMASLRRTEDFQEGPRAFVEKRAPAWKAR